MPDEIIGRVGNVTRDPELRYSNAGKPFATFGLAFNQYVPEGEPKPDPIFYEVVAFGSLGENVAECITKGQRICVVGKGQLDTWTDKQGNERKTKKIIADGIGPDLRFTTAVTTEAERRGPSQPAPPSGYGYTDEPF